MRTPLVGARFLVRPRPAPAIENLPAPEVLAEVPAPEVEPTSPRPGWVDRQRRARAVWRAREEGAAEVRRAADLGSRGF